MALLKSLIQRLLDSRTTPSEAAHSAMPNGHNLISISPTQSSVDGWSTVYSGIAPDDGYLRVTATAKNQHMVVSAKAGDMESFVVSQLTGDNLATCIPAKKGALISASCRNAENIHIPFFTLVGGGA